MRRSASPGRWVLACDGGSTSSLSEESPADVEARLQAPRTLWDSMYTEERWIAECCGEYLPILPRLQQAIECYPGTKLAITEYDYGVKHTISGGLAQADVLGAFGRYGVDVATLWGIGAEDDYAGAAFRLYRNYNGNGGTYGNTSVRARTDDRTNTSMYASIEDEDPSRVHVILINKNREGPFEIRFELRGEISYSEGEAWRFDAESASIEEEKVDVSEDPFSYVVPRASATHIVL